MLRVSLSLFLVASFACQAVVGVPGSLDASFGSGGRVRTLNSGDNAAALAVQTDGKLVVAGSCFNAAGSKLDFCAVRYNSNGTLDATFGSGGKVVTPVRSGYEYAVALAIQADGKLVLAGYCPRSGGNNDFCALRYNANGTLDTSFGAGGTVVTSFAGVDDHAAAVTVQPDGKIVVAGYCTGSGFICAVRYTGDGVLDGTFGSGGKVTTTVGSGSNRGRTLALQSDGKLLLAGSCVGATGDDFCIVRYNTFGALDASFGSGGVLLTAVGPTNDYGNALALQPDNKIVLAGNCYTAAGAKSNFCAVRYNSDGTLDATFGSAGKVTTAIGNGDDFAIGVALQPDGRLVLAGYCSGAIYPSFCALRYSANGALDTTFGTGGLVVSSSGNSYDFARAVALQPDGKIVVAGVCAGTSNDWCIVRYDGGPFGYQNCKMDVDGDNQVLATTDSLIHARIALGISGNAVVNGITFPPNATRNTWPLIRDYLVTQCGMSLGQ